MTTFDRPSWKARVTAWWQAAASNLPGTIKRLGVKTAYGLLTASAWLPLLRFREPIDGRATAYVCVGAVCRPPVQDQAGLRALLDGLEALIEQPAGNRPLDPRRRSRSTRSRRVLWQSLLF